MPGYPDFPPIHDDIREDLPGAPRPAQERMLRGEGWTEEQILAYLGPAPLSPEEDGKADNEYHPPDETKPVIKAPKVTIKQFRAMVAGGIVLLAAIVEIVINWDRFISVLRAWSPWLFG